MLFSNNSFPVPLWWSVLFDSKAVKPLPFLPYTCDSSHIRSYSWSCYNSADMFSLTYYRSRLLYGNAVSPPAAGASWPGYRQYYSPPCPGYNKNGIFLHIEGSYNRNWALTSGYSSDRTPLPSYYRFWPAVHTSAHFSDNRYSLSDIARCFHTGRSANNILQDNKAPGRPASVSRCLLHIPSLSDRSRCPEIYRFPGFGWFPLWNFERSVVNPLNPCRFLSGIPKLSLIIPCQRPS